MRMSGLRLPFSVLFLASMGLLISASGSSGADQPGTTTDLTASRGAVPATLSSWPPAERFGDAYWADRFGEEGLMNETGYQGAVKAVQEYEGRLVVGGRFNIAGGYPVRNLALWDGESYAPFPGGVTGAVNAMTVFRGNLIVAGVFTRAGEAPANNIAMWDGSAWHPLGNGVDDEVYALAEYNGDLIVGGRFRTAGELPSGAIARWDGNSWSPVGKGVESGKTINALAVYEGQLVAGGNFPRIGGTEAGLIARWDGSTWTGFGSPIPGDISQGSVSALTVHQGALIAGGFFYGYSSCVQRWDSQTARWKELKPNEVLRGTCFALLVKGSDLIVAGDLYIQRNSYDNLYACVRWDGSNWAGFAGLVGNAYYDLTVLTSFQDKVIATGGSWGAVLLDIGYPSGPIARLTSSQSPCFANVGNYPMGSGNGFYAILDYHDIMTLGSSSGLLRNLSSGTWSVESWYNTTVRALQIHNGSLFLGGDFRAGETGAYNIARWDSLAWSRLGPGLGFVNALAVYDGGLIAGGSFTTSGDGAQQLNHVAMWKNNGWSPLGTGLNGDVFALTVYRNELIAAGRVSIPGTSTVEGIARFDGTAWRSLGGGLRGQNTNPEVRALAVYGDSLVAAGNLYEAEGSSVNNVAIWDGTHWHAMGQGLTASGSSRVKVSSLAVYENNLVAAGSFFASGSDTLNTVARWTGQDWAPLGAGVRAWESTAQYDNWSVSPAFVSALGVFQGDLILGASCEAGVTAGNRILRGIGVWSEPVACISGFISRPAPAGVELRWQNPGEESFRGTLVRYSTTGFPADPLDGDPVPNGADGRFSASPGTRSSYLHRDARGGTYYYSAFAYDAQGRYSGVARLKAEVVGDLTLAIGVLQDPVLTENLDLYLVGTKPLKPGSVSLQVNGTSTPIVVNDAERSVWKAGYVLSSASGSVILQGCASDLADRDTCQTATFSATFLRGQAGGDAESPDRLLRVRIPPGSMARDGYLLILSDDLAAMSGDKQGASRPLESPVPDGCRLVRRYGLSPSINLAGSATVEFRFFTGDFLSGETASQLRIIQEGAGILPIDLDEENRRISAEASSLKPLLLVVDSGLPAGSLAPLRLLPVQPNPFGSTCRLGFQSADNQHVTLTVWDVAGRRVARLFDGPASAGDHWVTWDGSGDQGLHLGSGVYFARLSAGRDHVSNARILLVR
jgi:hypothetical protein